MHLQAVRAKFASGTNPLFYEWKWRCPHVRASTGLPCQIAASLHCGNIPGDVIRLHFTADIDPASLQEDWHASMATAGISNDGVVAFDQLMFLLGTELHLPLDIRRLHCGSLGGGETLLLQAISLMQHNRYTDAKTVLSHWLLPAALPRVVKYILSLANALAAAHLAIPLRPSETSHSVLATATPSIAHVLCTYQDQVFGLEKRISRAGLQRVNSH